MHGKFRLSHEATGRGYRRKHLKKVWHKMTCGLFPDATCSTVAMPSTLSSLLLRTEGVQRNGHEKISVGAGLSIFGATLMFGKLKSGIVHPITDFKPEATERYAS
jgi:hypothetical protein